MTFPASMSVPPPDATGPLQHRCRFSPTFLGSAINKWCRNSATNGVSSRIRSQPLVPEQVNRAVAAATTPATLLILALAAVHAARVAQIGTLMLEDVDIGNRRLTIAGRVRPLDDLTLKLLLDWLEHRRTRWPNTANLHLLINNQTANRTTRASNHWISAAMRGQAATLERLRIDRQLEEAMAQGPDPLHLAEVFGLDEKTAMRYADSARQLLLASPGEPPGGTVREAE
ncbi:hypothetical protein ACIRQQ_39065 [Streptomyces fuscichromogenes]|uniref:hypothetical protein n=1 Tax=Streptomyces fuscichromogenes TaxID=1324013 RepID=UPI003811D0B3